MRISECLGILFHLLTWPNLNGFRGCYKNTFFIFLNISHLICASESLFPNQVFCLSINLLTVKQGKPETKLNEVFTFAFKDLLASPGKSIDPGDFFGRNDSVTTLRVTFEHN